MLTKSGSGAQLECLVLRFATPDKREWCVSSQRWASLRGAGAADDGAPPTERPRTKATPLIALWCALFWTICKPYSHEQICHADRIVMPSMWTCMLPCLPAPEKQCQSHAESWNPT